MPVFKDISCSIQIGSSTLHEYGDVGDDQSSQSPVTKVVYIEAQESATFSIFCEVLPSYVHDATAGNRVSFRVYIDGRAHCRRSINVKEHNHVCELQGSYGTDSSGIEFVRPFQFAGVLIVEDHESDVRVDPSLLATMGEISVYVVRTRSVPGTSRNKPKKPHAAPEIRSIEKVNEKALKGRDLTHVTKCAPQPYMPEAPALK
ncbi:hypothetical protein Q9L58_005115 [Maublancomyces gigas]|uniref:DUF7918 domain-containing protein n=1 Tax=Discina gigas TaxID=1032678 RepID=A0ABR3GJ68_9PEZI